MSDTKKTCWGVKRSGLNVGAYDTRHHACLHVMEEVEKAAGLYIVRDFGSEGSFRIMETAKEMERKSPGSGISMLQNLFGSATEDDVWRAYRNFHDYAVFETDTFPYIWKESKIGKRWELLPNSDGRNIWRKNRNASVYVMEMGSKFLVSVGNYQKSIEFNDLVDALTFADGFKMWKTIRINDDGSLESVTGMHYPEKEAAMAEIVGSVEGDVGCGLDRWINRERQYKFLEVASMAEFITPNRGVHILAEFLDISKREAKLAIESFKRYRIVEE